MRNAKSGKRGFVISWFYPPINSSEGMVTYKLLKNSKQRFTVFTQKDDSTWSYEVENDRDGLVADNIEVVSGSSESFEAWISDCVKYFREHRGEFAYVMSRAMPPESHFAAQRIKEAFPDVVWVASFGDPIVDSPYHAVDLPEAERIKASRIYKVAARVFMPVKVVMELGYHMKIAAKYLLGRRVMTAREREAWNYEKTLRLADMVIFNNEYQKRYLMRGRPKRIVDKVRVVPHSYDLALYPDVKPANRKMVFSYFGHLDFKRSAKPILAAVRRLKGRDPKIASKVEFLFYGSMSDQDKAYVFDNRLESIVKHRKPLSYLTSLRKMKESDWLLLIDADLSSVLPDGNLYFASKLADYLGAGRPILATTMLDGISADILRETGGVVTSRSGEDVYLYLSKIIYDGYVARVEGAEGYDARRVAKMFDREIAKIL